MRRILINRIKYLQQQSIKAQTNEWFSIREKKISATNVSSIIGINNYKTKEQLLNDKIYGLDIIDNKYTKHGNMFEDIAISILEDKLDIEIKEVGFKLSEKYDFLGATPDGISLIGDELCLVEIKCPLTRKISGIPSFNYYTQMQTQLEVFNINKCLFFECNLKEITKKEYNLLKIQENKIIYGYNKNKNIYWKLNESSLNIVEKDNEFFKTYLGDLKLFNCDLINKKSLKKRKIQYDNPITKKHMKNYLMNNRFDTWMNFYGKKYYNQYYENNIFSKEILLKSIEKKKKFIEDIKSKSYDNDLKIIVIPSYYRKNDFLLELTKKYMDLGYDVIINPHFHHYKMDLYSNPTMIVRNNKLNILFNIDNIKGGGYSLINKVVKNIKFINNGESLSNDSMHKYIKVNNNFDNYVLNENQSMVNNKSFVVGEKWNYQHNGIKISSDDNNDFSKLGIVKLDSYRNFKKELIKYSKWIDNIKKDDDKYIIMNQILYTPYISSSEQSDWTKFKKYLLKKQNDVSLIYNIGKVSKQKINSMGIYSWKDPKFIEIINSNVLQISENDKNIINNIIKLSNSSNLIYPFIKNKSIEEDLKRNELEIFCDFETLNNFLGNENLIYLIGMTIKTPCNKLYHEYFLAENNSNKCEKIILDNFIDRINEIEEEYDMDAIIYSWSKAEDNFINNFNKKNNLKYEIQFTDLLEILKKNNILIKNNIYGFGLKNYVESMYDHNMIDTNYKDGDCDTGDKSIINAIRYYNDGDEKSLNDLIKYNEIDCCVMYKILNFIRFHYDI